MGKLTPHVLNVAAGTPAAGMRDELRELSEPTLPPRIAFTDADGRCAAPLLDGVEQRTE